jgi:hypothetical protein
MNVYQAINAVQAELAKIGISKNSRNTQGAGYNFRGIDAVYNTMSSIMAEKVKTLIAMEDSNVNMKSSSTMMTSLSSRMMKMSHSQAICQRTSSKTLRRSLKG